MALIVLQDIFRMQPRADLAFLLQQGFHGSFAHSQAHRSDCLVWAGLKHPLTGYACSRLFQTETIWPFTGV